MYFVKGEANPKVTIESTSSTRVILNCRKVAQKIVGCVTGEYLKTICETCAVPTAEAEKIRHILRQLDLPSVADKKRLTRELESLLKNDYVNLLKYIRKGEGDAELRTCLRDFLRSVMIGNLAEIYRAFVRLVDIC